MTELYNIVDGIYLSNLDSAYDISLIKKYNIKMIIRLSDDKYNSNIYDNSIIFFNIELEDNIFSDNEMIKVAKKIFITINSFDGNILIHCNQGQSRSVSVIIYYLIKQYNYTYDQAFEKIKNIKSDINPNPAFQKKLKNIM
jgi:protein-tyrosine phosphatase